MTPKLWSFEKSSKSAPSKSVFRPFWSQQWRLWLGFWFPSLSPAFNLLILYLKLVRRHNFLSSLLNKFCCLETSILWTVPSELTERLQIKLGIHTEFSYPVYPPHLSWEGGHGEDATPKVRRTRYGRGMAPISTGLEAVTMLDCTWLRANRGWLDVQSQSRIFWTSPFYQVCGCWSDWYSNC